MNLTPHFTDSELNVDGQEERIVANARHLCNFVLEPIREKYGPVIVTSGYRPPDRNAETGGVSTSEHLYQGDHAAADFQIKNISLSEVFDWIRKESGLPFRQVILEYGSNNEFACIHISHRRTGNDKREALIGQTHGQGAYQRVECLMPMFLHDDEGGTA